jgi:hypothetical protein
MLRPEVIYGAHDKKKNDVKGDESCGKAKKNIAGLSMMFCGQRKNCEHEKKTSSGREQHAVWSCRRLKFFCLDHPKPRFEYVRFRSPLFRSETLSGRTMCVLRVTGGFDFGAAIDRSVEV